MRVIPNNWTQHTIGDLIRFEGGSQPPKSTFIAEPKDDYVRLIQIRDYRTKKYPTYVPKNMARKFCTKDDIMIGRYGPPVFQILKGLEGAYNVALIKAIPDSRILKKYAWHFLKTPSLHQYIESLSQRSSGQTGIEMDELKAYPLPLPPLSEQKHLSFILDVWDRAISISSELLATKEILRKGITQQLLTGKWRYPEFIRSKDTQVTKYGDIPMDWEYPKIQDVASSESLKNKNGRDLPVLSCTKHKGLVDSLKYFGKRIYSEDISTYKIVKRNQFAYATNHIEEGSIGYQNLYDAAAISPMYTVFETNNKVDDSFLYLLLKTEKYRHIFEAHTNASVDRRGSLRWKDFSSLHIPLPEIDEQKAIAKIFKLVDTELELLNEQLNALKEQKKGLMQQLLTGKTRVKTTEAA